MKIIASGPITSWQIDGETVETVTEFIFLGCKITVDGDCCLEIKRRLLLGKEGSFFHLWVGHAGSCCDPGLVIQDSKCGARGNTGSGGVCYLFD